MPALRESNPVSHDVGRLLIRLMVGVVFAFHGSQKLFGWFGGGGIAGTAGAFESLGLPLPAASAVLAGSAEFFGGLAVLSGFGLRVAVVPMVFTMLTAAVTAHWGTFAAQAGGMEYPLTLAFVLAGLGFLGPGRFTVARALRRRPEADPATSLTSSDNRRAQR